MQQSKLQDFIRTSYSHAISEFNNLKVLADPVKVLESLPKASLTVLIAAKKVAERAPIFNYEAVLAKYRNYTKTH